MASNLDKINGIKSGASTNDPTLKISEEVKKQYVTAITDFRKAIQTEIDNVKKLPGYDNSGGFQSALQTKINLQDCINEFIEYMGNYVAYLDVFNQTVEAALTQQLNQG